jgi:hypothetical protein
MRDDENLAAERATFVTHLECSATGARYAADELHNLSRERKPLLVRYDLAGVKKALNKEALVRRPRDLWRYRELLPVRRARDIVSLGEPVTPIMAMPRLAKTLKATEILVNMHADKFGGEVTQSLIATFRPAKRDHQILSLDESSFAQPAAERGDKICRFAGRAAAEKPKTSIADCCARTASGHATPRRREA